MNGSLIINNKSRILASNKIDNDYLQLNGATNYNNGAYLILAGKDYDSKGSFQLTAQDGISKTSLLGKANGELTWSGKSLVPNISLYSNLSQIGIEIGTETLLDIAKKLPNNSILAYYVTKTTGYNVEIYPSEYGNFYAKKFINGLVEFNFTSFDSSYINKRNYTFSHTAFYNANAPDNEIIWKTYGLNTYTRLIDIGIEPKTETLKSIAQALPPDSMIIYFAGKKSTQVNAEIYPNNYGFFEAERLGNNSLVHFTFHCYDKNRNNENINITYEAFYNDTYPDDSIIWRENLDSGFISSVKTVKDLSELSGYRFFESPSIPDFIKASDFQGIQMRNNYQAVQLIFNGAAWSYRFDDNQRDASDPTPTYGSLRNIIDDSSSTNFIKAPAVNNTKLMPLNFQNATMTKLTNKAYDRGNIPLSQAYTNFDGLYIEYTGDSNENWSSVFISTWELQRRIANAKKVNGPLSLFYTGHYWSLLNTSTTTNLIANNDNCIIQNIYGVKW